MKLDWWKPIKTGGEYTCESCRRTTQLDYQDLQDKIDNLTDERDDLLDQMDDIAVKHILMRGDINRLEEENRRLIEKLHGPDSGDVSSYQPFVAKVDGKHILVSIFTDSSGSVDSVTLAFRDNTWDTWSVPIDAERG